MHIIAFAGESYDPRAVINFSYARKNAHVDGFHREGRSKSDFEGRSRAVDFSMNRATRNVPVLNYLQNLTCVTFKKDSSERRAPEQKQPL